MTDGAYHTTKGEHDGVIETSQIASPIMMHASCKRNPRCSQCAEIPEKNWGAPFMNPKETITKMTAVILGGDLRLHGVEVERQGEHLVDISTGVRYAATCTADGMTSWCTTDTEQVFRAKLPGPFNRVMHRGSQILWTNSDDDLDTVSMQAYWIAQHDRAALCRFHQRATTIPQRPQQQQQHAPPDPENEEEEEETSVEESDEEVDEEEEEE